MIEKASSTPVDRELGKQPIAAVLESQGLRPHDLVAASDEQITHKMVSKACKGRRLTRKVQDKVIRALNKAAEGCYTKEQLFTY